MTLYGEVTNTAVLELIGDGASILDVGCGAGAWAEALRRSGARHLVGIEPDSESAALAASRYNRIVNSPVEQTDLDNLGPFDVVIAADVIEHLVDPWAELARLRTCVAPGGHLVVSTPNARCIDFWGPIALSGRLDYDPAGGILDRSHLRWFTRRTLSEALEAAGWMPSAWRLIALGRRRRPNLWLERIGLGEFLPHQLVVRSVIAK